MLNAEQFTKSILAGFAPRQRDILTRRFGLDGKEPLTLAELGERYKVTRERVRQIESSVLAAVHEKMQTGPVAELVVHIDRCLQSFGGVRATDALFEDVASKSEGLSKYSLAFIMEASKRFYCNREDGEYVEFWYSDKNALKKAVRLIDKFYRELKLEKDAVLKEGANAESMLEKLALKEAMSKAIAENYIAISKKFGKNVYGEFGLAEWPEIQPKTVRDQAYLVLRRAAKPLHFSDIAELINSTSLGRRAANVSTVHNELIKDNRFVLVGRGMYALTEHGYEPGTAKEVIEKLMKKHGSLHLEQIVELISAERFFKRNTILLNLQNKKLFKRLDDGKYYLAEA